MNGEETSFNENFNVVQEEEQALVGNVSDTMKAGYVSSDEELSIGSDLMPFENMMKTGYQLVERQLYGLGVSNKAAGDNVTPDRIDDPLSVTVSDVSSYVEFSQIGTPAAPVSGKARLYAKSGGSDSDIYSLDSDGNEVELISTDSITMDVAYNGGSTITADTADVIWKMTDAVDFEITNATTTNYFKVNNSGINIDLATTIGNNLALTFDGATTGTELSTITYDASNDWIFKLGDGNQNIKFQDGDENNLLVVDSPNRVVDVVNCNLILDNEKFIFFNTAAGALDCSIHQASTDDLDFRLGQTGKSFRFRDYLNGVKFGVNTTDNIVEAKEGFRFRAFNAANTQYGDFYYDSVNTSIDSSDGDVEFNPDTSYRSTASGITTGWQPSDDTWTYASSDDPTYTFTITGDRTDQLVPRMRLKLTDSGVQYFIVTAVAYSSPNTTVTIYGGTDYDLSTGTITLPFYSNVTAPQGFPQDPAKWTVETTDATNRTQATPTQNQWYNINTTTIAVPLGIWIVSYNLELGIDNVAETAMVVECTISTANNTESDSKWTTNIGISTSTVDNKILNGHVSRERPVTLATKDTYYLNTRTVSAGIDNIQNLNGETELILTAVSSYL